MNRKKDEYDDKKPFDDGNEISGHAPQRAAEENTSVENKLRSICLNSTAKEYIPKPNEELSDNAKINLNLNAKEFKPKNFEAGQSTSNTSTINANYNKKEFYPKNNFNSNQNFYQNYNPNFNHYYNNNMYDYSQMNQFQVNSNPYNNFYYQNSYMNNMGNISSLYHQQENEFYGNNSFQNYNNYIPNQTPQVASYSNYHTGTEAQVQAEEGASRVSRQNKALGNEKFVEQEESPVNEDFYMKDNNELIEDDETDKEIWFPKFQNCDCCQGFVYKCQGPACLNMGVCYCKVTDEIDS